MDEPKIECVDSGRRMSMSQPWELDSTGSVVPRKTEHPVVLPGDWPAVEAHLGLALPSDYKELICDGPTLEFDRELVIYSPFDSRPSLELFRYIADSSLAQAFMRSFNPDFYSGPVYPEMAGILGWGVDGGGGEYYWDTADPDPDRWTVVVTGRPVDDYLRPEVGIANYLDGLADGTFKAAALSNWPRPNPQIRPIS